MDSSHSLRSARNDGFEILRSAFVKKRLPQNDKLSSRTQKSTAQSLKFTLFFKAWIYGLLRRGKTTPRNDELNLKTTPSRKPQTSKPRASKPRTLNTYAEIHALNFKGDFFKSKSPLIFCGFFALATLGSEWRIQQAPKAVPKVKTTSKATFKASKKHGSKPPQKNGVGFKFTHPLNPPPQGRGAF